MGGEVINATDGIRITFNLEIWRYGAIPLCFLTACSGPLHENGIPKQSPQNTFTLGQIRQYSPGILKCNLSELSMHKPNLIHKHNLSNMPKPKFK